MARWVCVLALLACAGAWAQVSPRCDLALARAGAPRPVTSLDLVRLRDVSDISISPDGRQVLFRVTAGDEKTNTHCAHWYVAPSAGGAAPRALAPAGDLIFSSVPAESSAPVWLADGRDVLYLEGRGTTRRIVRQPIAGGGATVLVEREAIRFALSADGTRVIAELEMPEAEAKAEKERIARNGLVYDEIEVVPFTGPPEIRVAGGHRFLSMALDGSDSRDASADERTQLNRRGSKFDVAKRMMHGKWNRAGNRFGAFIDPSGTAEQRFHSMRFASGPDEDHLTPVTERIQSVVDWWWSADGREIIVNHQVQARTIFKRVDVDARRERTILDPREDEVFVNCDIDRNATTLACTRQSPLAAPEVVAMRLADGHVTVLTDLNPEFHALRKGAVRKYQIKNRYGDENFARLVLPVDYEAGRKYPLVVTTYNGGGFLRGNTGNEYPIHAMSAQGMAVLSWGAPRPHAPVRGETQDFPETLLDFTSPLESLREITSTLVREGVVDEARVGICGMSFGSQVTNFAISHSTLFAAAAVGNPGAYDSALYYLSDKSASRFARYGLGLPSGGAADNWNKVSASHNADRITAPLLMQYSDTEYIVGMEQFMTMRALGKAVDLIIYPRERHLKMEPAHKLVVYERNLDWFRFWLKGETDPDPAKASQYKRWELLKGR